MSLDRITKYSASWKPADAVPYPEFISDLRNLLDARDMLESSTFMLKQELYAGKPENDCGLITCWAAAKFLEMDYKARIRSTMFSLPCPADASTDVKEYWKEYDELSAKSPFGISYNDRKILDEKYSAMVSIVVTNYRIEGFNALIQNSLIQDGGR